MAPLSEIFIQGLSRQSVDLRRLEDSAAAAAERVLKQAEKDILADLAERSAARRLFDPSKTITWREARMAEVIQQTRDTLATAYGKIDARVGKRMQDAAGFSFQATAADLERGLAPLGALASVNTVAVGPELLERIARDSFVSVGEGAAVVSEWWASQEKKLADGLAQSFRSGMLLGEGVPGLTRRLQATSGAVGMPIARRWATAVARTGVISTAREARMQTFQANRHVLAGFYHFSTLDKRTTVVCISYSGKAFKYTEDGRVEPDGHGLPYGSGVPRHVSCRSTELAKVKTWEEQGIGADELSPGLRRAFGPRATAPRGDLNAALKADPDLAKKLLGPTRHQLWDSGRARLDDFVDPLTGRQRTVTDLRGLFADGATPAPGVAKKGPKPTALPKTLSGPEIRRRLKERGTEAPDFEALRPRLKAADANRKRLIDEFFELEDAEIRTNKTTARQAVVKEELALAEQEFRAANRAFDQPLRTFLVDLLAEGKHGRRMRAEVGDVFEWKESTLAGIEISLDDLGRIWGKEIPERFDSVRFTPKEGRASYRALVRGAGTGEIELGGRHGAQVATHELGHWLEDMDPAVHDAVVQFLLRRTAPNPNHPVKFRRILPDDLKWLGEGFPRHEKAWFDEFIKPYMGKRYGEGSKPRRAETLYATEILSVGLEFLLYNTAEFAAKDPEFFDFIVDILRGVL